MREAQKEIVRANNARGWTGEFSRAKAKKKVLVPRTQEK
jgi:hypothetical protein